MRRARSKSTPAPFLNSKYQEKNTNFRWQAERAELRFQTYYQFKVRTVMGVLVRFVGRKRKQLYTSNKNKIITA